MSTEALFMLTAFGLVTSVMIIGGVGYIVALKLDRKYGTESD